MRSRLLLATPQQGKLRRGMSQCLYHLLVEEKRKHQGNQQIKAIYISQVFIIFHIFECEGKLYIS